MFHQSCDKHQPQNHKKVIKYPLCIFLLMRATNMPVYLNICKRVLKHI